MLPEDNCRIDALPMKSAFGILTLGMSFWKRLFKRPGRANLRPRRLDYLNEALALERQGDFDAALTSYRLALRDDPNDLRVLQNIAIAFSKTDQHDEAIRHYRKTLEIDSKQMGAHYGLAFLLIKRGEFETAASHLRAFLTDPPRDAEAQKWIEHARAALKDLGLAEGP